MIHYRQIRCPLCGENVDLENNLKLGDVAYCTDCDEELKVVNVNPPKLKRMVELLEVNNGNYKNFYEEIDEKKLDETGDDFYREEF